MTRLRGVVEVSRFTVEPDAMPDRVDHYSIPALDAAGEPDQTERETIDSHKLVLRGGEVLVSRLNPRKPRVHAVPHELSRFSVASTEFVPLQPIAIDAAYLRYLLLSEAVRQELDSQVRSATRSHQRVEPSNILNLAIPVEDADEQRRIADFLDDRIARVDQIVAARNLQSKLLRPRRHAAVVEALAPMARVPLRRLLRGAITGGTPDPEANNPAGVGWYSPAAFRADLTLGEPTRLVDKSACVAFAGQTVVMIGIGATAGKVAWLDHPGSGNQQLTCLLHDPKVTDGRFLLHQLDAMSEALLLSAPAATLPIINNETLKSFPVAAPELLEQRRLAADWDSRLAVDGAIAGQLDQSVRLLSEYKQSLITAAVTGEFDVTTAGSGIQG